jgi:hypothetical protein
MRKALGFFFAAALLVPVGVIATSPAGAAAKLPTCKTLMGVQTFKPGLPKLGDPKKVTSTTKSTAKITGCTGGGVTGGTTVSKPGTYKGNCTTLLSAKKGTVTKGSSTITWSNHKTSTVTTTLTSLSAPGSASPQLKLESKFTVGQFKGTTSTTTIKATAPAGSCTQKALTQFNFVNTKPFTNK